MDWNFLKPTILKVIVFLISLIPIFYLSIFYLNIFGTHYCWDVFGCPIRIGFPFEFYSPLSGCDICPTTWTVNYLVLVLDLVIIYFLECIILDVFAGFRKKK